MYRQQKRMASAQVTDSTGGFHLKFLERAINLPAVNMACNVALQTYKNVKASNRLVGMTLNTAEKASTFVTQQSLPVIMKFENQIRAVDDVACRGLQNLEAVAPVIVKHPDEVLNYGKDRYNETVQSGLRKFSASKNYMKNVVEFEKQRLLNHLLALLASPPGQVAIVLTDRAIEQLDSYVDYYYPSQQSEEPQLEPETKPQTWVKLQKLGKKLQTRAATKLSRDLLGSEMFVVNLYSNVANFSLAKTVDEFLSSPTGLQLLKSVDSAFDQAECYLDYYLPPLGDEGSEQPFGDRELVPVFRRADVLSSTLRERLYKHALLQLQRLQMQGKNTANRLQNLSMVYYYMQYVSFSASSILCEGSEYARCMLQFAFSFSSSITQREQSVARLCDLAYDALDSAGGTARSLASHPDNFIEHVMTHQKMFLEEDK